MLKKIGLLVSVLAMTACSVNPKVGSNDVRIVTSAPGEACQRVGEVYGDSGFWGSGFSVASSMKNARAALRNNAINMGANLVFLETNNQFNTRVTLVGQAFKCP